MTYTPPTKYSVQIDAHGNVIICADTTPRKGYRVEFIGSYKACWQQKLAAPVR